MKKINKEIIRKAEAFVLDLFDRKLPEECVFHSKDHTLDVMKNALTIGKESGLSVNDLNCLALGAVFHDAGYVSSYDGHEIISAQMAREFLISLDIDDSQIKQVERAILATRVPQSPEDLVSKVLCDADLMHLTYPDYFARMEPLRLEWKLTGKSDLTETQFHRKSIDFFNMHNYHTSYGRQVLAEKKHLNLERIKARIME